MDKRRKELALIAVGALVVLVALYLTFRPRTRPAAAQTSAPVAQATAPGGPAQPAAPAKPAGAEAQPALVESGAATTPGRDPFRPIVMAQASAGPSTPAFANPISPKPMGLPPLTLPGVWTSTPPPAGTPPAGMAPAAAPEPLRLTGVVQGNPSVAVLRQGSKRYIVTIGDPVDNQYIVKSISAGRVVLAKGERTLSLSLGGRM